MHRTLLLADDSPTIQRVIELTFADQEFDVICVSDGQAAVDRIVAAPPDIVLADVEMPERTGYEVCTFVKQSAELAHIPVVLLTGAFEPIDETRASEARCDAVLAKPFEPRAVVEQVKSLLAAAVQTLPAEATEQEEPASGTVIGSASVAPEESVEAAAASVSIAGSEFELPRPGESDAESVDEYLDRLDAAFASLGSSAAVEAKAHRHEPAVERAAAAVADAAREGTGDEAEPAEAADVESAEADERRTAVPVEAASIPVVDLTSGSGLTPPAPEPVELTPVSTDELEVESEPDEYEPTRLDEPAEMDQQNEREAGSGAAAEPAGVHELDLEPPTAAVREPGTEPGPLADAFESLLAEERGERRPVIAEPAPAGPPAAVTLDAAAVDRLAGQVLERLADRLPPPSEPTVSLPDDVIDEITRRVAERISHQVVRETVTEVVLNVADRLVREEIDRIKADAS